MGGFYLVTGATGGLGKEICKILSKNNYNLIIHGRSLDKLTSLEKEIKNKNIFIKKITGDLSKLKTSNLIYNKVRKLNLKCIINNAAIYNNKHFNKIKENEIISMMNINLISPILLIQKLIPLLKKNTESFIININSIAGTKGGMYETIYSTSKFGLRGFADSLQYETTKNNIRLINFAFGGIKTNMTKKRKDYNKLILPKDAAQIIFNSITQPPSLRVTEINVARALY